MNNPTATQSTVGADLARLGEISRTLLDYSTELADIRERLTADYEQWAKEAVVEAAPQISAWITGGDLSLEQSDPLDPCEQVADCWHTLDELTGICDEWGGRLGAAACLGEYRVDPEAVDDCTLLNVEEQCALKRQRKQISPIRTLPPGVS